MLFERQRKDTTNNGDLQIFAPADAANTAFIDFNGKNVTPLLPLHCVGLAGAEDVELIAALSTS